MHRALLVSVLLAFAVLPGCVDNDYHAFLAIEFGDIRMPIEVKVPVDPDARPASDRYAKDGGEHPDFYSAMDLLEDGRAYSVYTYNATYNEEFRTYFLNTINGLPVPGEKKFWLVSVDGVAAETGFGEVPVLADQRIAFTLTPFAAPATTPT